MTFPLSKAKKKKRKKKKDFGNLYNTNLQNHLPNNIQNQSMKNIFQLQYFSRNKSSST